jgi:hypothetical protein
MKTYKNKIIDDSLARTINELNHNISMLSPGEWTNKNPSPVTVQLKKTIIDLQKQVESKLKRCPDFNTPTVDVHGMTSSQILEKVRFERLKAKK